MKKIFAIYKNPKIRMRAVLIPVVLFMICSMVFIGNELIQNSIYYLRNVERQQQKYIELLSVQMDLLCEEGASDEECIDYMKKTVMQSGNSWFYLAKDSKMIFVRDDATTEALGEYKNYRKFMDSYSDSNVVWTHASFGEGRYEVGTISAQDYLLNQAKVIKHIIYIGIAVLLCTAAYLALTIILASMWNDTDRKNKELTKQLVDESLKVEALLVQLEQEEAQESKTLKRYQIYNRSMAETLLVKSDDEALYPLSVMIIKVVLHNMMYTRRQLYNMIQVIQDKLNTNQLVAEIRKGEFAVLMYHTTEEEALSLKEKVFAEWKEMESMRGVVVRAAVISTDNQTMRIQEHYEQCLKKLRREDKSRNE